VLFAHGRNYNEEKDVYKRGTVIVRQWNALQKRKRIRKGKRKGQEGKEEGKEEGNEEKKEERKEEDGEEGGKEKDEDEGILVLHEDLIEKDEFYEKYELVEKLA